MASTQQTFPLLYLARISAISTLVLIGILSRFGRGFQQQFPILSSELPGWIFFVFVAVVSLVFGRWIFLNGVKLIRADRIFRNLAASIIGVTLTAVLVTEWLIVLPIERMHALKYNFLSFSLFFSQSNPSYRRRAIRAFFCCALIGGIEEFLQRYIPGRFFDVRDIMLNVTAALTGAVLAFLVCSWKKQSQRTEHSF